MANTPTTALEVIKKQLETTRPTFEEMNLNKLSFAKEMEFAIQIFEKNDYLAKMNPQSIRNCLVNIALSGLTLNPVMKFAYLVPRKGICCVDPSYAGLIKIITDTGSVQSVKAAVVYEGEPFDIERGSAGFVRHGLAPGPRGKERGAYSIAVLNDGTEHIDWMYWDEIMAVKARSESVKADKQSPWSTDQNEMAKKTVVKRHWKYLPKSERALLAAHAIDLDNQTNGIDFEKEQKAKEDAKTATPNAPIDVALAMDEDLSTLLEWFDNPELPEIIFGKIKKSAMRAKIEQKYALGQLEKDKAEEYIKGLQEEVDKAKAAQQEGAAS
jgi:recombination protein RecT